MSSRRKRKMKKARNTPSNQSRDIDSDDEDSIISFRADFGGDRTDYKAKIIDQLNGVLDLLCDKKTSKSGKWRMKAYEKLLDGCSKEVMTEFCAKNIDVFTDRLIASIKQGSTQERCLVMRAASVLAVTLGDEAEPLATALVTVLVAIIEDPQHLEKDVEIHKDGTVIELEDDSDDEYKLLVSSFRCLSILIFIFGSDKASLGALEICTEVWQDPEKPDAFRAAAISAWSLIASGLPTRTLVLDLYEQTMVELVAILEDEELNISRLAAGEAVALLYSAYFEGMESDDAELGEFDPWSDPSSDAPDTAYVLETLEAFANEFSKGRSRKELKTQRKHFRQYKQAIEEGDPPTTKLKLKGNRMEIVGWRRNIVFNSLREALGTGLQVNLVQNPWLQDQLGLDVARICSPKSRDTRAAKNALKEERKQNLKAKCNSRKLARDKKSEIIMSGFD